MWRKKLVLLFVRRQPGWSIFSLIKNQ